MKRKEYGLRYRLPDEITDVVPDLRKDLTETAMMHCHDFYEIEVFLDGTGTEVLSGHSIELRRGCVTLLSPSDFHEVIPRNHLTFYNFMFRATMLSPELLHELWASDRSKCLSFEEDDLQEIISICELLTREDSKQSPDRSIFMKNLMECFFMLLLRALRQMPEPSKNAIADTIQNSIVYLHQHFKKNPSLSRTAAVVNLHPNYFSQRFREITGQTYTAYLTDLKLTYAKKLLLSSNLSVTEICFASGFTSISNFLKVFKNQTGLSPLRYIERHNAARELAEKS